MLSIARACRLQDGRVFYSASASCALFPRLTSPEVHPVPSAYLFFPAVTAKAHARPGQKGRLISIRRFISSRLPAQDDVTTHCCSFSILLSGRAAGSKDPKDDDRRGKLVSKGNGRIFDEKGGLLNRVISREMGPFVLLIGGRTLTKEGKSSNVCDVEQGSSSQYSSTCYLA
jgi:hypothetical protein